MEKRNLEQCCAIKFCVKLVNENATETYKKLKWVYGEHALSRAQVGVKESMAELYGDHHIAEK